MGLLGNFGTSLTLLLAHLSLFRAHREHKVHNIVLYPDKESWCKTTPIKQVVTWPACSSQELDNNVCVGACFSYMVPHSEPSVQGDLIKPYCDSCQPLDSIWHTVSLDCKDKDDILSTMQKKVQIITNCSCSSCMESSRIKPDLNNLLQSLELESAHHQQQHHHHGHQHQQSSPVPVSTSPTVQATSPPPPPSSSSPVPEPVQTTGGGEGGQDASQQLVVDGAGGPPSAAAPDPGVIAAPSGTGGAAEAPVATAPPQHHHHHHHHHHQSMSNGGGGGGGNQSSEHQAQLGPILETPDLLLNPNLNGSGKPAGLGAKAHERFYQLFKQLNDPSLADDKKLKKLAKLASLEKLEKLEKLATEYAGAKELLAKLSELLHKYSNQDEQLGGGEASPSEDEDVGLEGGPSEDEEVLQLLPLLAVSSTSLAPPPAVPELDDEEVPSLQNQQLRVAASLLHRTGPHHSLVLDADAEVKEKIDVESHYLHPALAGQEISYHDNVLHDKTKDKDF
ncbi:uncharacterized protein LOC106646592 [Copidosoma floridanum]|uniref:uncharacterized protein LOC106646592 n=1 Tax=Copidosoma floridanum TaxID=29053 RepID=UPI0006C963B3|nr:uncharacterized protein LOC106646592 [Copidosoma floridanum]